MEHLDVEMIAVSRAPIAALQAYRRRMGWTFRWAEDQQRSGTVDYNYRPTDTTWLREAGEEGRAAEHATYARGLDALWG